MERLAAFNGVGWKHTVEECRAISHFVCFGAILLELLLRLNWYFLAPKSWAAAFSYALMFSLWFFKEMRHWRQISAIDKEFEILRLQPKPNPDTFSKCPWRVGPPFSGCNVILAFLSLFISFLNS
jgi:hypothetical protein